MNIERSAQLVLRAGVAFAFLYPPFAALQDPQSWLGYFPHFMRGIVADPILLHTFGAIEVVIALWLLSGRKVFWPAAAATVLLLAIVIFDFNDFEVLFRDLAIAGAALSLAIQHYPRT